MTALSCSSIFSLHPFCGRLARGFLHGHTSLISSFSRADPPSLTGFCVPFTSSSNSRSSPSFSCRTAAFYSSVSSTITSQTSDPLLMIADIDPAAAKLAIVITGPLLSVLGFLFVVRIVMSWYPKLPVGKFPYIIAYVPTEPVLSLTRKVIPPLGGVDVTPVIWFGLVSFLSEILVGPQGILVLLSQHV